MPQPTFVQMTRTEELTYIIGQFSAAEALEVATNIQPVAPKAAGVWFEAADLFERSQDAWERTDTGPTQVERTRTRVEVADDALAAAQDELRVAEREHAKALNRSITAKLTS